MKHLEQSSNNIFSNAHSNNMLRLNFGLNGPNLKCVGAAYTINQAEKDLARDIPSIRKAAENVLHVNINYFAEAVNNWIDFFYGVQTTNRTWLKYSLNQPPSGCTRDALVLLINSLDSTKKELITKMKKEAIRKGGQLVIDRTEPMEYLVSDGNNLNHPGVERFTVIMDKQPEPIPEMDKRKTTPIEATPVIQTSLPEIQYPQLETDTPPLVTPVKNNASGISPLIWVGLAASILVLGKKGGLL